MDISKMNRFVTCEYDNKWWLAYVVSTDFKNEEITTTLLHPYVPASSFVYSGNQDGLIVGREQILSKAEPRTATGCTYYLIYTLTLPYLITYTLTKMKYFLLQMTLKNKVYNLRIKFSYQFDASSIFLYIILL